MIRTRPSGFSRAAASIKTIQENRRRLDKSATKQVTVVRSGVTIRLPLATWFHTWNAISIIFTTEFTTGRSTVIQPKHTGNGWTELRIAFWRGKVWIGVASDDCDESQTSS